MKLKIESFNFLIDNVFNDGSTTLETVITFKKIYNHLITFPR